MSVFRAIIDGFWDPDIWLPPNITWKDIEPNDEVAYADHRHLLIPLPLAACLLLLRYVMERFWYGPIGISLGIRNSKPKRSKPNEILEKAYRAKEKIKHKQIVGLAKQLSWTERQVERWLRLRRSQDKPSPIVKFCETSWRCSYYTCAFLYGVYCLWDKPWLWDINHCWYNYPHQSVTSDCWWYYMVSMAFYWSLAVSQFFDVKRKDFWQMFIHHIATIILMVFSWICNLFRIGTLVLIIHDCADIFLEASKIAKYASYQRVCDTLFVIFIIVWISTRLVLYPHWIIYSTSIDAPKLVAMFPAYYVFNSLLITLLVLHFIWTYDIIRLGYNSLKAGQVTKKINLHHVKQSKAKTPAFAFHKNMEGDIRSSSSDDLSDDDSQ